MSSTAKHVGIGYIPSARQQGHSVRPRVGAEGDENAPTLHETPRHRSKPKLRAERDSASLAVSYTLDNDVVGIEVTVRDKS